MKKFLFLALLFTVCFNSYSRDLKIGSNNYESIIIKPSIYIDITFKTRNGYEIRIRGEVKYGVLSGNVTIKGTLTITDSSGSMDFPLEYSGHASKGPNKTEYDMPRIDFEQKEVVELIMSRLYLEKDLPKSYFK